MLLKNRNDNISLKLFLDIWKGSYKEVDGYERYYKVDSYGKEAVNFNNYMLDEIVSIESLNDLPPLYLQNCSIRAIHIANCKIEHLYFASSEIKNIIIEQNSIINDINFYGGSIEFLNITESQSEKIRFTETKIEEFISIGNNSIAKLVELDNIHEVKNISIKEKSKIDCIIFKDSWTDNVRVSNSTVGLIQIDNSKIINNITIDEKSITNKIKVNNGNVKFFLIKSSSCKAINFDDDSRADLYIDDYSIIGPITINNSKIKSLSINENSETQYISVQSESQVEFLSIKSYSKTGTISAYKSTVGNIDISDSKIFGIVLEYLSIDSKQLIINNSTVERLLIGLDKPYKINITDYSQIHELDFTRIVFHKDLIFQISDTEVNRIILDSFINLGIILFNNLMPINKYEKLIVSGEPISIPLLNNDGRFQFAKTERESIFKIINSDIGKTQFIGCNIQSFGLFIFLNSKMLDAFVADTLLPDFRQIGTIDKFNPDSYVLSNSIPFLKTKKDKNANEKIHYIIEQQRLAMSQFKKIYENRGDIVRATEYHAYELECYRRSLRIPQKRSRQEFFNNRSERFNLFLNRFSGYYGNNWLRAVFVTLIINTFLFTIYCYCLGFRLGYNLETFGHLASYSFEFLNPLRKADFLKDMAQTTDWGRVVDYLSRIIMAYFVYQTIQAFRKFGKKST